MKVANLYEDQRRIGRNDGAPLYTTVALRDMGHEVEHLIPDPKRLKGFGRYDLSLWVDWGADALKGILDYEPVYSMPADHKACWLSDTHLGYDHRLAVAQAIQAEGGHVFCMQKRAVEEFSRDGVRAHWLPHAFEPKAYPKYSIIKRYDVCFIGHVNSENRINFLDRMFREFENFAYGQRLFEDAARIYSQSRIVLNPPIKDDLNMRVFEALGSGSFLLTRRVPHLEELLEDGKHLALYDTLDEAVEKAKYYISHEEEREKIAAAGYEEVSKNHTYRKRMEKMLEIVLAKQEEPVCP